MKEALELQKAKEAQFTTEKEAIMYVYVSSSSDLMTLLCC